MASGWNDYTPSEQDWGVAQTSDQPAAATDATAATDDPWSAKPTDEDWGIAPANSKPKTKNAEPSAPANDGWDQPTTDADWGIVPSGSDPKASTDDGGWDRPTTDADWGIGTAGDSSTAPDLTKNDDPAWGENAASDSVWDEATQGKKGAKRPAHQQVPIKPGYVNPDRVKTGGERVREEHLAHYLVSSDSGPGKDDT
jgi:hypothetical protein